MGKKKSKNKQDNIGWAEVKRRCRLNAEDVRMAKELGFNPKSLVKNIPSKNQPWKMPVKDWIRDLHNKKIEKQETGLQKQAIPTRQQKTKPAPIIYDDEEIPF